MTSPIRTDAVIALLTRLRGQVQVIKTETKVISEKVEAAHKAFLNYEALERWLDDPENVKLLHVGMCVYFVDPDMPDLWYAGEVYGAPELSGFLPMVGKKIDLSPFVRKDEIERQIHDEIAEEKGVPGGLAFLDESGDVASMQTSKLEKIINRGIVYPTLDTNRKILPEFIDSKNYELKSEKGQSNGFCPLDLNKRVPDEYLPIMELKMNKAQPLGYASLDHNAKVPLSQINVEGILIDVTPATVKPKSWSGDGVVGSSLKYAREDHQHPMESLIDSTAVHKTGNETIVGVKTFTNEPIVSGSSIKIGGYSQTFPAEASTLVNVNSLQSITNKIISSSRLDSLTINNPSINFPNFTDFNAHTTDYNATYITNAGVR